MRFCLLLLFFSVMSCSQDALSSGKPSRAGITNTDLPGDDGGDDGDDGSSSSSGPISSVSMRYAYPAWPDIANAKFYHVPSFSDLNNKEISKELGASTTSSSTKIPTLPIKYTDATNGRNFCFSNEEWTNSSGKKNFPSCIKASSNVVTHIKNLQKSNSGLHSVFISALQFNFKNAPEASGGDYSEVYFQSASIEKSKISFNASTGYPVITEKNIYNYGTGECNIDDQDAVGFEVENQGTSRFLLSGIASFERGRKKVFGEGTSENRTYEATECQDGSGQGFLCNLIADKVSVWHAMFVPIIYKNSSNSNLRLSHRQFPNQVVSDGSLSGSKGSAVSSFGYYANSSNLGTVVSTPVMGRYDRNGNEIPNWEQSFITKFCLKGRRKEKTGWTSLVKAMYFELRSPRIKKNTGSK